MSDESRPRCPRILIRRLRARRRLRRALAAWIAAHPEIQAEGFWVELKLDAMIPHALVYHPRTHVCGCATFLFGPGDLPELEDLIPWVEALMAPAVKLVRSCRR